MGRAYISESGRRFTSEYQPANRGRPKGSLNRRTILRAWIEAAVPQEPEATIQAMLNVVFEKKKGKRRRRV